MSHLTNEYRLVHKRTLRSAARRAALNLLSLGRPGLLTRWNDTPRIQFLVMHHVFDDERRQFESMVQRLGEHFDFVSYSEAVRRLYAGDASRPCLAISFDDGFKNCLVAAEILERYGATACYFVCPRLVGERRRDRLAAICRDRWAMPTTELMNWDDLESLVDRGHEIGGHTMAHPYMQRLSLKQAELEIGCCRAVLMQRFGTADHFAWPYGGFQHMRSDIATAVFENGFTSCASGHRGSHRVHPGSYDPARPPCIHRDSIVAAWPLRHIEYFLAKSAASPIDPFQTWPSDWSVENSRSSAA